MPAVRLSSRRGSALGRRRSSLAGIAYAKPGTYGYSPSSPQAPVTFAPNVTPVSYSAPSPTPSPFASPSLTTDLPLPLFPPSATPAPPPTRKRVPPGKRRSQGYVPRPPNAFMLFRADFVRQKHVPGSIETNHGSLSKIIGNCWRALPLPEKHIWETKAKHAKAEHKLKYPDYKFRPVHNKRGAPATTTTPSNPSTSTSQPAPRNVSGGTTKPQMTPQEDERRCEEVAALLLQGKKGEELAWAVRDLDLRRKAELAEQEPVPYHQNSKFPHPLNLDPLYYPSHNSSSPPSSSLASSLTSGSGSGSPYSLPMPLGSEHGHWRHRRSSSVPLPNEFTYSFPPFGYGEGGAIGLTLPALGFPSSSSSFILPPPPPSSSDDSLAGLPLPIAQRPSFSWANNGSSFSYPRPSFSFGPSARGSFSFANTFGSWGGSGGIGRRASSAQAYFSPTAFPYDHQQQQQQQQGNSYAHHKQQHEQEELPDADTSLFEPGFLHSFGASASTSASPTSDGVSPFDAPEHGPVMHAPQPVHPVSPLGVEFAEQQQQHAQYQEPQSPYDAHAQYAEVYQSHRSTPTSAASYAEDAASNSSYAGPDTTTQTASYADEAAVVMGERVAESSHADYPPFEFPSDEHHELGYQSQMDDAPATYEMDMDMDNTSAPSFESYASEFV
ncbi:hypothetical protein C8J57DRAFT_1505088 [Mycena rebaudengoi]|nr:hypothetical protein C8J57DRAFT_1505088 [Mycena rebaudengoi]